MSGPIQVVTYLRQHNKGAPMNVVHVCQSTLSEAQVAMYNGVVLNALEELERRGCVPPAPEDQWEMFLQAVGLSARESFSEGRPGEEFVMIRAVILTGEFAGHSIQLPGEEVPHEQLLQYEGEIFHQPMVSRAAH